MGGAVAHEDKGFFFREILPVLHESADSFLDVLSAGQKRRAETDGIEVIGVSEHILFHQIIFDSVDDMGWAEQSAL